MNVSEYNTLMHIVNTILTIQKHSIGIIPKFITDKVKDLPEKVEKSVRASSQRDCRVKSADMPHQDLPQQFTLTRSFSPKFSQGITKNVRSGG